MTPTLRLLRRPGLTLANLVDELCQALPDRVVAFQEVPGRECQRRTVRFLHQRVNAYTHYLRETLHVQPHELVAIWKRNDTEYLHWFLAVMRAGAIAVPLNSMLTAEEVRAILHHCGATLALVDGHVDTAPVRADQSLAVRQWVDVDAAGIATEAPPCAPARIHRDDPVAIFHTSGTTGHAKGVTLSSHALLAGRKFGAMLSPLLSGRSIALISLPWAHIMAVSAAIYGILGGIPAYCMERFDPQAAMSLIERRRITTFIGVPTMLTRLAFADDAPQKLRSVRMWISASDYLPPATRHRLVECGALLRVAGLRVRPLLVNIYGMAESGGLAMCSVEGGPLPHNRLCFALPPARIRIADENGREMPRGEVGECQLHGPGRTSGYWRNAEATRALHTHDGWLRTGDLGVRTLGGFVKLAGRAKDVIKCGGYTVYAEEVERALAQHPAVAAASVVGAPDNEKGEIPVAFVERAGDSGIASEELLTWCRQRLAPYKAPRRIHVTSQGDLPRGPTGKILKRELRARLEGVHAD